MQLTGTKRLKDGRQMLPAGGYSEPTENQGIMDMVTGEIIALSKKDQRIADAKKNSKELRAQIQAKVDKENLGAKRFGDGQHESSLSPRNVSAYSKATGIPVERAKEISKAINAWSEWAYEKVRAAQKAGRQNKQADLLNEYLDSATPFKGTIYRGIGLKQGETIDDAVSRLGKGTSALSSWSSTQSVAVGFAMDAKMNYGTDTPVLLSVKNKLGGASIKGSAVEPSENEVLVRAGTKYRERNRQAITDKVGQSYTLIELEEV